SSAPNWSALSVPPSPAGSTLRKPPASFWPKGASSAAAGPASARLASSAAASSRAASRTVERTSPGPILARHASALRAATRRLPVRGVVASGLERLEAAFPGVVASLGVLDERRDADRLQYGAVERRGREAQGP